MQPSNPSWRVTYSPKQPVPEYQCHHDDCRRTFVRKTSLTNHLKAHQNVRSRSIYRTKRARLRAAAARAAAEAAASVEKHEKHAAETRIDTTSVMQRTHIPPTQTSTAPPLSSPLPSLEKPPLGPETSPISSTAPTATPQPSATENAETLLNDISLSLVSPLSFTPQDEALLPNNAWPVEQTLPMQIRPTAETEQDPAPAFTFPPERTSEELLDPSDPNYDFLHDLYKYH